jgi:hypothetical protein
MVKKNSYPVGVLIGILFPAILFGLLFCLNLLTGFYNHLPTEFTLKKKLFVCLALNILPIRYYFTHEDVEKTGKGLLIITILLLMSTIILL